MHTDSEEDVIFVTEKRRPTSREAVFDKAKRRALQRDIDQESQPKPSPKPLDCPRPLEEVKMKIEDVRSPKNHKKKSKKEQVPEKINCTVEHENPAEVKKEKKKCKKVKETILKEEFCDANREDETTKRKMMSATANDASSPDVKDEHEGGVVKKKKKKRTVEDESQMENVQILVKEEANKNEEKNRNKIKNKSVQAKPELERVKIERGENDDFKDRQTLKKPKKEKNKPLDNKEAKKAAEEETNGSTVGMTVTKKRKKDKSKAGENGVRLETTEEKAETVIKLKKKTKKDKSDLESVPEEVKKKTKKDKSDLESVPEEVKPEKIKGKKKKYQDKTKEKMEEKDVTRKKEKRKKSIESADCIVLETEPKNNDVKKEKRRKESVELAGVDEAQQKKKRKKARSKGGNEELLSGKCEEAVEEEEPRPVSDTASKTTKQKKSTAKADKEVDGSLGAEPGAKKKKKIKQENNEQQDIPPSSPVDVVFLSEKRGNSDEVTINMERRQALQMEINKASQPHKPDKPLGLGQWSSAEFSTSEQQQKFLRLMGGFKKGLMPTAAMTTGATNMALGKDGQQQLQSGLLGQFQRAHSRHMDFGNRGAGLGYSAPSKKKFSIDINACRSTHFDD